jgi:hypothetical protein
MAPQILLNMATVVLAAQSAVADLDSLADRMLVCNEFADDSRRLACYDDEARSLSAASENSIAESSGTLVTTDEKIEPTVAAETAAALVITEEAATASAAETAAKGDIAAPVTTNDASKTAGEVGVAESSRPSASDTSQVDNFGMTPEMARANSDAQQDTELREITATVVAVSKRPGGELLVTLDNGQVWTENDAEYGFRVKVGDSIVVKKGKLFGGYRMVTQSRRSSAVRRIE